MTKKIFTPILCLACMAIIFSSCTKSSDVISNQNDLVGTWSVVGIRSNIPYDWNGDGYSETDIYGGYSYCQQDIAVDFEPYGNGQSRQGCNASWHAMSWQLTNNDRTLRLNLGDDDLNLDVVRFTANTIVGNDQVYVNGRNFVITYTFQRR